MPVWIAPGVTIDGVDNQLDKSLPDLGRSSNRLGTVFCRSINAAKGSSGVSFSETFDTFVLEASGSLNLAIGTPNNENGAIAFHDADARNRGLIRYLHSSDTLELWTAGSSRLQITSSGQLNTGAVSVRGGFVSVRDGLNPTEIQLHGTYTSGNDYERLRTHFDGSAFVLEAEAGTSGGVVRNVKLHGANRSTHIASPTNEQLRDILISHGLMESA